MTASAQKHRSGVCEHQTGTGERSVRDNDVKIEKTTREMMQD